MQHRVAGGRSTKAEMLIPATLAHAGGRRRRDERSTKAEMLIPATLPVPARPRPTCQTLNEGRDVNPGDTRGVNGYDALPLARSTKAEMLIPATHAHPVGRQRPVLRSTKAEMLIPATRRPRSRTSPRRCALNEGRDVNPGDTI